MCFFFTVSLEVLVNRRTYNEEWMGLPHNITGNTRIAALLWPSGSLTLLDFSLNCPFLFLSSEWMAIRPRSTYGLLGFPQICLLLFASHDSNFQKKKMWLTSLIPFKEQFYMSWAFYQLINELPLGMGNPISSHPLSKDQSTRFPVQGWVGQFKPEVKPRLTGKLAPSYSSHLAIFSNEIIWCLVS